MASRDSRKAMNSGLQEAILQTVILLPHLTILLAVPVMIPALPIQAVHPISAAGNPAAAALLTVGD